MAYGALTAGRSSRTGIAGLRSLNAVTATSTASSTGSYSQFALDKVYSAFGLQVVINTTKATKVMLEGSLDGSNWDSIAGSTWVIGTQVNGDIVYVTGKPVTHVRANYVTKGSTKPLTAWVSPGV